MVKFNIKYPLRDGGYAVVFNSHNGLIYGGIIISEDTADIENTIWKEDGTWFYSNSRKPHANDLMLDTPEYEDVVEGAGC